MSLFKRNAPSATFNAIDSAHSMKADDEEIDAYISGVQLLADAFTSSDEDQSQEDLKESFQNKR